LADFNAPTGQLFRKKPITVQAIQWDGTMANAGAIVEWIEMLNVGEDKIRFLEPNDSPTKGVSCIQLNTAEGTSYAYSGDWVVWGTKNDVYPCTDSVFKDVFEPLVTV